MRNVDDMGRIVLPKSIRNLLRLTGNDIVEFYVGDNNVVCIQKVSHTSFMPDEAKACLKGLFHLKGVTAAVCNLHSVVATSGGGLAELEGAVVNHDALKQVGEHVYHRGIDENILLVDGHPETRIDCAAPLYAGELLCGLVALFCGGELFEFNDEKQLSAELIASILSNWHTG